METPERIAFEPIPMEEQETIISIDHQKDKAFVYTSRVQMANNLLRLVKDTGGEAKITRLTGAYMEIMVPKSWVILRPKRRRELTEEQRAELSERMKKARKLKK